MTLSDRAVAHLRQVIERPETVDDRYVVHEEIGRGGMGVVFRATDTTLERDVALKVINPRATSSTTDARLAREAQILAHLEHPGIVPVHDSGVLLDGRVFYVMRLVRGARLDAHITSGVSRGELLRTMLRLCETMAFAHDRGIVHRDLKPGNVMIGPFGEVLVLDWGVAKVMTELSADGVVLGTPGFMSPEQAAGHSAFTDPRADVFSLGAILDQLLNATTESVARPLRAIVAHATAHNPSDRYASALELADDVRHWLDGAAVSAYRESVLERALRFYRRHQIAILLIAAYLIVRTTIVIFRRP